MFGSWFGGGEEAIPTPSVPQPPARPDRTLVPATYAQHHQQQQQQQQDPRTAFAQSAPTRFEPGTGRPPQEFCNAFVAAAGNPLQSEEERRSRIAHYLDMGVPIDHEDPDGVTALLAAAVSGFIDTVNLLLTHGALVDRESSKGGTALIVAAAAEQLECITGLIQGGAHVDRENTTGKTALMVAVQKGCIGSVEHLVLVHGADPNRESITGQSPLMVAVEKTQADIAAMLCRHGAVPDKENRHGDNAHLVAIRASCTVVMTVMMDHGADPERETSMGLTPLMQAALAGDVDCGQLLIRRGASLDRPSKRNGCTPLIQAVMAARIDAVEYLIHLGASLDFEAEGDGVEVAAVRMTALCAAVMHNQGPSMELLLRKGAEVDRVTADGYTALMHAAASGHVELIYPLVSAGANPNYESVMGHTPLHCAVLADQSPSVCKLVEMGARVTAATLLHRVRPPLHRYFYTASSSTSPEANQLQHSVAGTLGGGLTVDGTMSNAPSQQQLKVHQALYGFMALVDQAIADVPNDLLDQLAAVGAGHFAAAPPASSLHAAVEAGNATLLRSLIGFGADPNAVDRNGNTALHLAVVLGKPGLVPELVAAGTVVERLNKDGKKAADLCDTVAHPELARLLALLGSAGTPSGPLATGPGNGATSAGTGGRPQGSNAPGASNGGGGGKAASDVLSSHGDAPNVPSNVPSKIPPSHGGASNVPSNVASNVASNVSSDLPTSHIEVPNVPPKHSASGMGAAGGSTAAGVLAGQMMATTRVQALPSLTTPAGMPAPPVTSAYLATQLGSFTTTTAATTAAAPAAARAPAQRTFVTTAAHAAETRALAGDGPFRSGATSVATGAAAEGRALNAATAALSGMEAGGGSGGGAQRVYGLSSLPPTSHKGYTF